MGTHAGSRGLIPLLGRRIKNVKILAALFVTAGLAAAQNYFPLETGNQWIYRSGSQTATAEVVRSETFDGHPYSLVRGFFGDAWLRTNESGALVAFNPDTRTEQLWAAFGAADGSQFQAAIPPCEQPAQVASKSARYIGPIGEFSNALEIRYGPGRCADAGNERDIYLPWVGLVQRRATTIAGPRVWDLIYARMGTTEISASETSFQLALDHAIYTANLQPPVDPRNAVPLMIARLTLRHIRQEPLRLTFPSGQRFDLVIRNERNDVVLSWSASRSFIQVIGTETIEGERNWVIEVPLGAGSTPLPQGRYVAEGWLTTEGPRAWTASVGFEVRHVF